jgi:hypothetical protein
MRIKYKPSNRHYDPKEDVSNYLFHFIFLDESFPQHPKGPKQSCADRINEQWWQYDLKGTLGEIPEHCGVLHGLETAA